MTLGPHDYVPVLKVKRGEKEALRAIDYGYRSRITPLLEIVERTDPAKSISRHLDTAFSRLAESLDGYPRCFLDAREIASGGAVTAQEVFDRAAAASIAFTPVTGVTRIVDVAAAIGYRSNGLALRLTRHDFENGALPNAITTFLYTHSFSAAEVDIIVDLGPVDDMVAPGIVRLSNAFLAQVPHHSTWRSFTISGCAFPKSMGGVPRNSHALVERWEWIMWRDNLQANANAIPRVPTFSDCAIQHPTGVEGYDFRTMRSSATIRYTLPEYWLLVKGESTRNVPPSQQFPRLAYELVYGNCIGYYMGSAHCLGCASIERAANGEPGLGSAGVWRRIGTTHHLSTVIQYL